MRYVLALGSLVLGIVLLILGAGQRAFLSGMHDIEIVSGVPQVSYTVFEGSQLSKNPGFKQLDLGHTAGTIVVGNAVDVLAWAKITGYTPVQLDTKQQSVLTGAAVPAGQSEYAAVAQAQLAQSDLWSSVVVSDGKSPLVLNAQVEPWQAVLVAQEQPAGAQNTMRLHWHETFNTPWAGPLLSLGGLFTLLGVVLYVLFVDRDRRGLGPQRGRSGPLHGIRGSFKRKAQVKPIYQHSGAAAVPAVTTSESAAGGTGAAVTDPADKESSNES